MKRVILALLFMLLPAVCYADAVHDVMIALKHLEGVTTYGTSYQDYASYLEEAKSEVDLYLKGDEAKQHEKLTVTISELMGLYELADPLFRRLPDSNGFMNIGADASPMDKKIASEYFSRFPQDKKDVAKGGVLKKGVKLHLKSAITKIFKRASAKYAEAVKMLNQTGPSLVP